MENIQVKLMRKMHVGGGAFRGCLQGLFVDSGIQ